MSDRVKIEYWVSRAIALEMESGAGAYRDIERFAASQALLREDCPTFKDSLIVAQGRIAELEKEVAALEVFLERRRERAKKAERRVVELEGAIAKMDDIIETYLREAGAGHE